LGTALVAIPLLILLVGWGFPSLFTAVFFIVTVAALREYFVMVFPGGAWNLLRVVSACYRSAFSQGPSE
jgi:hypothetical protein